MESNHKTRRSYKSQVIALRDWVSTHKRMPNRRSEDPEERRLGIFVMTLRTQATNPNCKQPLSPEHKAILLTHIPDFVFEQRIDDFEQKITNLAEVINSLDGEYPSRSDPKYKREAKLIQHLRSSYNGTDVSIQLTPDRIAFIEYMIPGFKWEAPTVMLKFEDLLSSYNVFYQANQRHARRSGKRDEQELKHGMFLANLINQLRGKRGSQDNIKEKKELIQKICPAILELV